jgi:hypothetical protein
LFRSKSYFDNRYKHLIFFVATRGEYYMFKFVAAAAIAGASVASALTPTASAQAQEVSATIPASRAVAGTIQAIDPVTQTVTLQTLKGETKTYKYMPGSLDGYSQGSAVVVTPSTGATGTVLGSYKDHMRVRLDSGEHVIVAYVPQPMCTKYHEGDRIALWTTGHVRILQGYERTQAMQVDGYLSQWSVAKYEAREVPQLSASSPVTMPVRPAPPETIEQPSIQEPVRALW